MAKTRPLSPHLQIYKLPLPAVMSITHRISGVVLSSGTLLLALWLMLLASGETGFATAQMVLSHPLGMLVMAAILRRYSIMAVTGSGIYSGIWAKG